MNYTFDISRFPISNNLGTNRHTPDTVLINAQLTHVSNNVKAVLSLDENVSYIYSQLHRCLYGGAIYVTRFPPLMKLSIKIKSKFSGYDSQ
jgi:hypothetical protein